MTSTLWSIPSHHLAMGGLGQSEVLQWAAGAVPDPPGHPCEEWAPASHLPLHRFLWGKLWRLHGDWLWALSLLAYWHHWASPVGNNTVGGELIKNKLCAINTHQCKLHECPSFEPFARRERKLRYNLSLCTYCSAEKLPELITWSYLSCQSLYQVLIMFQSQVHDPFAAQSLHWSKTPQRPGCGHAISIVTQYKWDFPGMISL